MTMMIVIKIMRVRNLFTVVGDVLCRQFKLVWVGLFIVFMILLYLLPLFDLLIILFSESDFGVVLFNVLVYVLVVLGLNIVFGYVGLFDLGYVGFYAIGVYMVGVFGFEYAHLLFLLILSIAVLVVMVFGILFGALMLCVLAIEF